MTCPFCGHGKVIVNRLAPIGGTYVDPLTDAPVPRIRCERCGSAIAMSEVQPSRPPKGGRGTLPEYDREEHQDDA